MSRERKPRPSRKRGPANPAVSQDAAVEQIIDAIDFLRNEMRTHGLPACADVLDDAFARCLDLYVRHKADAVKPDGHSNGGKA